MVMNLQARETPLQENDTHTGTRVRRNEFRSAFLITALHMTGKGLGLVKTLVIAAWFGASGALDAFWVAYMIPQLMPGLILGVVTTAFIPSFMRSAATDEESIDWRGLNTLFTLVGMTVITIAILVVLARSGIVSAMAPGLPADVHALAAKLMGLMAIAVVIFGINAMLSAVMQATHRFGVMSLESIITNIFIIAGAIYFSDSLGVLGLAYAVIGGFGIHMMLLIWVNRDLIREKLRPAFDFSHNDFRGSAGHMLPLLIGFFGSVGMTIVDRIFVSTLDAGAISILVYASMIALLPMEVFGHAVFTAFYPGLSQDHANGHVLAMRDAQIRGMRLLLFVMLPAMAGLVMVSDAVVSLLLQRGAFSNEAAGLTAATMAALAIGLPLRAVNYFNFRVLHARREPWIAVSIGLFGVSLNVLLDMLLIEPFGVVGIAFATSMAMAACTVLSTVLLQRRQRVSIVRPMLRPFGKLVLMTLTLVMVAGLLIRLVDRASLPLAGWQLALIQLAAFIPAALSFLLVGYLLRFEEVHSLLKFLQRRVRRQES
ncbi:MAG TPA: murein biosynthesis integral membrane protein MurJ [Gammaproteobacteria bacterium]